MSHRKKYKGRKSKVHFPPFLKNKLGPVGPDEFLWAFEISMRTYAGELPQSAAPSEFGVGLVQSDGEVGHITFTDIPWNRAMLAIKQHFGDERREEALSTMTRLMAIGNYIDDPELRNKGLIYEDDEGLMIDEAVLRAAAEAPMTPELLFEDKPFRALIESLHAKS